MSVLPDFPVVVPVRVAWGEMDAFGHVNNIVFLRYFETARIAYFEAIGFVGDDGGPGPILASTHCRFRRPLEYPDTVHAGARVTETGDDRFTMEYALFSEKLQDIAATGGGVIVGYDYRTQSKAPLPARVRDAIRALEDDPA